MASGSETVSIGVAIQGSDIRAVVVAVGPASSAVRRYASVAHSGADLPRSVARIVDALDSDKKLPVGITGGRMADAEERNILAAIGPGRMVKIHRQGKAIAQLNLAPGTKLDTVEQLPTCAVPSRLFEVHPELRFPDLLGAIGSALAIAEQASATTRPGGESAATAAATTAPRLIRRQAPPAQPPAEATPASAAPPMTETAAPPRPSAASAPEPIRIKLPKPEQTMVRHRADTAAPDPRPADAPPPAPSPGADPGTLVTPPPAPPAGTDPGTLIAPPPDNLGDLNHVAGTAAEGAPPGWGDNQQRSFAVPLVRLGPDDATDYAGGRSSKRRWLAGRRPLPVAAALLVVLVGLGIALGILLGGDETAINQPAMALLQSSLTLRP